jgi:ABC-2 type transport system permease protein
VQPSPARFLLFLGLGACTAVIVLAFGVLMLSIAFWAGNTEGLGVQVTNALLNFSTYPMDLFNGAVKVALFTLLPAGFASYLPVTIIRDFDALRLAIVVAFTCAFGALSVVVFYTGLHRYESGSLVATQG